MSNEQNRRGYVNAVHVFGKTMMARLGSTYHIQWVWTKKSKPIDNIKLTKKQYDHIKSLLGPVTNKEIHSMNEAGTYSSIKIWHSQEPKHYMRVKRYLKKEGILK